MSSMSSAQKSEVKAWEEEIEACDHARSLAQDAATRKVVARFFQLRALSLGRHGGRLCSVNGDGCKVVIVDGWLSRMRSVRARRGRRDAKR